MRHVHSSLSKTSISSALAHLCKYAHLEKIYRHIDPTCLQRQGRPALAVISEVSLLSVFDSAFCIVKASKSIITLFHTDSFWLQSLRGIWSSLCFMSSACWMPLNRCNTRNYTVRGALLSCRTGQQFFTLCMWRSKKGASICFILTLTLRSSIALHQTTRYYCICNPVNH